MDFKKIDIKNKQNYVFEDLSNSPLLDLEPLTLDRARKKYWKLLQDTGDNIIICQDWDTIKRMSLDELLENAELLKKSHYSSMGYDEYGFEEKSFNQYKKFIKKYSK